MQSNDQFSYNLTGHYNILADRTSLLVGIFKLKTHNNRSPYK